MSRTYLFLCTLLSDAIIRIIFERWVISSFAVGTVLLMHWATNAWHSAPRRV